MKIAIIAALPRELASLTRGWTALPVSRANVRVWQGGGHVAACAGMGTRRATLAVEAALSCGNIGQLLSAGLAGACDPELTAGDVVRAGQVVDAGSGERFGAGAGTAVLVTAASLAGAKEKARLRGAYHASAVDMEAATVARLARAHGLAFAAIKAISDEARTTLEGLDRFATADGQFDELRFALSTAVRPGRWRAAVELGRNSARALRALTAALEEEITGETGREL